MVLVVAGPRMLLAAAKTDVIELTNGDRITCEISRLEHGKLTVKTDGLGTIAIEWDDIARLTSTATYDVELTTGRRLFGSLSRGDANTVDIVQPAGSERIALDRIVRISPVGKTFWRRLDGSLDAGFSFTQADVQTVWTLHSDVRYRSQRWFTQLTADSALTTSEDTDQSRNDLTVQTQRFLRPLWSLVGFAQFQQNEELSLKLRAVLGGGIARTFAQSNRVAFTGVAGAAFTRERYEDTDEQIPEAVAGTNVQWFTFDGRSTNLNVGATSYYALDGSWRVRLELNTSFRSDIVGDLYWSINSFDSYTSQPPPDQKHNDFGVSATIGWSF